jgi:hypothetical protein
MPDDPEAGMLAEMAMLEVGPLIIVRLPFSHGQLVLELNWSLNNLKFPTQNRGGTQSLDKEKSRGNTGRPQSSHGPSAVVKRSIRPSTHNGQNPLPEAPS